MSTTNSLTVKLTGTEYSPSYELKRIALTIVDDIYECRYIVDDSKIELVSAKLTNSGAFKDLTDYLSKSIGYVLPYAHINAILDEWDKAKLHSDRLKLTQEH